MMEGTQETRGMVRRMMCNSLVIVKAKPADTPSQVVFSWAEAAGVRKEDARELLDKLRQSLPFEEDGCLRGAAVLDALGLQAKLMRDCDWVGAKRLRDCIDRLREQFRLSGLL